MSMPERRRSAGSARLARGLGVLAWALVTLAATAQTLGPRLGQPVSPAEAARGNWNVFPDGRGLPAGRGTAQQGEPLFRARCASCHGDRGRGASAEELTGGSEPLTSPYPDKTIGMYWPYATTLFDVIRRSMPMEAPGSLSPDAVYALTAYLLAEEGLIGERDEMNARTLPALRMPNRDGFIPVDVPRPR